ncbi:hypothetical protein CIHG_00256 [Coccidioides immitis H538.4]|uniref:Uncharacterized protein n=3 Tax=Coccidioides immitis TaxID=5501 RepID=A0A0J8QLU9_COCIT|nr:hypothetical protein CIRG_07075 [Coccidioides immitis RMSCC 2394]KMU72153.1 hypothetical protein CISG_00462 [Coccidioides immitis RMSCC 3703]KMU82474.1 hypothetical protein CIHG_00256 [Coccidioides immitis H538.4]
MDTDSQGVGRFVRCRNYHERGFGYIFREKSHILEMCGQYSSFVLRQLVSITSTVVGCNNVYTNCRTTWNNWVATSSSLTTGFQRQILGTDLDATANELR